MASDPASGNEEELLSQIDELKARMDRLMSGGTSTSNSALLTDKPEAKAPAEPPVAPPPGPNRTRVRDLIDDEDTEVIESYPGPKEVVPFPNDSRKADERPERRPEPERVDKTRPVGGSVIPMEDGPTGVRPRVSSFDDLGNVIQQELAKDELVPPPDAKKGPGLASRFGPPDESTPPPVEEEAPGPGRPTDEEEALDEPEAEVEAIDESNEDVEYQGNVGKVAAIWAVTALASGAIAALHFAGII
jgi:hypothetical protein